MPCVTVQEQISIGVPARSGPAVEPYDFRRPTTLAREHSRVLELALETFARQWGTQLTAKVRVVSQVTCEQIIMETYDEYASSLPATTAMILCNLEGMDARAVIQFPATAALTWVSYMLGSNAAQVVPERKFTQIEQALVRRLFDDALEDLRYSLGPLLETAISIDTIQYNSQFAQAAATADLMIVATFAIRVGDSSTTATLAIPAPALLPQLGQSAVLAATGNTRDQVASQLGWVPVEVALSLNPVFVKPSRVLGLSVGDLLTIPHPQHRPLNLTVDGETLARAAVGANGARLACVVVEATDSTTERVNQ
ncbi:flagellar motor switch protein FliM [soil metagenome]